MMRTTIRGALAVSFVLGCLRAATAGDVDINVNIGRPAPPRVYFEREPELIVIPDSRVRRLPDYEYDFYRYDDVYYLNKGGHWYRAKSWRGPFDWIPYDDLPRSIVVLPPAYRKHPAHPHGGPPGQLKKQGIHVAPGHSPGHGKGKSKGHGKSKHH